MPLNGTVAPLVFDGSISAAVFEAYVEQFFPRTLQPSDIFVADKQRTGRLDCLARHLGYRSAGRLPTVSPAGWSSRSLLRVVRRRARLSAEALRIVDIDDWAWRHNHRYGSIVCDLERLRRVILSPNRELATAKAWLAGQPGLAIVARDSGGVYGEAIAKAPFWSPIAGIWCRTPAAWVAPRYVYSFA